MMVWGFKENTAEVVYLGGSAKVVFGPFVRNPPTDYTRVEWQNGLPRPQCKICKDTMLRVCGEFRLLHTPRDLSPRQSMLGKRSIKRR